MVIQVCQSLPPPTAPLYTPSRRVRGACQLFPPRVFEPGTPGNFSCQSPAGRHARVASPVRTRY
jgi:hypothetical protein